MRYLGWICWYLWEGLPTLFAFPIDSNQTPGTGESWSSYWELKWPRYAIGTLGFVVVALTLAGCMCCRRQRRPKGFQDDAGNGKEFKDGSTAATETTIERVPSASLELEVPRLATSQSSSSRVQFEALPVERLVGEVRAAKPKPPSPSLYSEDLEASEKSNFPREQPCREWFAGNSHVPRGRLKYLREIGRGWFGKVVEGTAEIPDSAEKKNRGVVVRILTEEATTSEKTWFLGEATPYLKLSHPNILTLLGSCLETEPYLLLFESCPAGDLKGFLRGNRDKGTCEALRKENVPTRMALDIANALEHMHDHGFAHTDLSARNCLVAPDLSAKLGDYGTGVEKYPGDYYVVGDRALPIRWSAPESLNCTETTIETRTITPRANLWSFAVLLWEIATWGERPFDDLGDEQVIEMIFSLKTSFFAQRTCEVLLKRLREEFEAPRTFREAVEASWKFLPEDRATLKESKEILGGKRIEDFEKRWENLKPNGGNNAQERDNRSASLQDLRGSVDEQLWEDKNPIQAQFRLGPEEPVKNVPSAQNSCLQESGSETEEESWRGRVERGAYTEKVKQKSKSVADLMVLVHIDSDSDAEVSLGPQISEKAMKKRLPASGSDGDLRSHNFDDEFDEAIRKLRDNSVCNGTNVKTTKNHSENSQFVDSIEKPKVMTLTHQGQTPILRLCFGNPENAENSIFHDDDSRNRNAEADSRKNDTEAFSAEGKGPEGFDTGFRKVKSTTARCGDNISSSGRKITTEARIEGPVLRLLSKGDPQLPVLRYDPGISSAPQDTLDIEGSSRFDSFLVFETPETDVASFSDNFKTSSSHENSRAAEEDSLDVELWNNALAYELEKKNPGFEAHEKIFDESIDFSRENAKESPKKSASAPNTPKSVNFKLEENARKDLATSAPETPRKNDFHKKIDEKKSENVNYSKNLSNFQPEVVETSSKNSSDQDLPLNSCSLPETPEKRFAPSQNQEKSSNNVDKLVGTFSAPETPTKHYTDSKIEEKSSQKVTQSLISTSASEIPENPSEIREESCKNLNQLLGSFSAPETPEKHYFQPETSSYYQDSPLGSSSAPETPGSHYFASKTEDKGSKNKNQPLGSSSAPETPEKHYFEPERDETSSKASYYQDLPLGSSSAPETPGNHYFDSNVEGKSPKNMNYYPDSLGSTSAPETPQFRGSYVAGNLDDDSSACEDLEASDKMLKGSTPDTPQSRGNYSVGNGDDSSTGEDLDHADRIIKRSSHEVDDEEDRKHLSTPDDERSSDSGFRDKESCEEEESPVPCPSASSIISGAAISSSGLPANSSPLSASAEEEQMRILFELDTILDAEYYGSFRDSERLDDSEIFSPNSLQSRGIDGDIVSTKNRSISESLESTESTDVVETVRANSCEPDFLDSRTLRKIATLKDEEDEEQLGGEDMKKLGDFLKREAEDCDYFVVGSGDDTEADFLGDSASESLKNLEELSGNLRKDSGDLSAKNDSKSWDSSTELRRFNVDSSGDGKFDKSNESYDLSLEFRSSDASEINKSKMTDSNSGSPMKSERISGNEFLIEGRRNSSEILQTEQKTGHLEDFVTTENSEDISLLKSEKREKDSEFFKADAPENHPSNSAVKKDRQDENLVICRESSDSTSQSPRKSEQKTENSEIFEATMDFENSASNSPLKSEKTSKTSEICEALAEFGNSASSYFLKSDENNKSSEICQTLVELEKSASNSSVKSEKNSKTSDLCEASVEFENSAGNSSVKSEKNSKTSDLGEASVEFENSVSNSSVRSEKNSKTSELCEALAEFENSASNSPLKSEKHSEVCEASVELKNSASNSPQKSEKTNKSSEICEALVEFENSASNSPLKSEKTNRTSEICEAPVEFKNSASNSPQKSDKDNKSSEINEAWVVSKNSASNSPVKSEKTNETSEISEALVEFENSASNSPKKSDKDNKSSETNEALVGSKNSRSNSPVKTEKTNETSEISEALLEFENSVSNSSLKIEKCPETPEICEASPKFEKSFKTSEKSELSTDLENSSSNSPLKSSKPLESSEKSLVSPELETSASTSPQKSSDPQKTSEPCEASAEFDNSTSTSPQKFSEPQKTSEPCEASAEFDNSTTTSPQKSSEPQKTCKPCEASAEFDNSTSTSPQKCSHPQKTLEPCEASAEFENSSSTSPQKMPKPLESPETCEASETDLENSPSLSPVKTDRNQTSDLSMETRGPESVHSDVDQWSSRENINDNENDDEDSSTMSLRSDNSYVSFGLDEEFVAAIRNELREKLPRAQMPVIEALDPRDEKEPSINKDAESKRWEEEEAEENAERGSGGVDIAIRYNIYGTPLSPILEERESAGTSESIVSKEDSRDDASIASRVSALSEDVLVVDTRTNKAMMLEANSTGNGQQTDPNSQQDEDRDTSQGDFSDEENLEYPQNHLNRGLENKRISMGSGGAPLPSPEEESKWQQQFPLPLQMQDDLMSTSFGTDRDWDSQDDDEGEEGEDGEEDEEENSSSSGEFVWKRYDESHGDLENVATRSPPNKPKSHEPEADLEEEDEGDEDDEEEEEEFTPSAWDATLAPHRSALRSPEKTLKSGDQKKSVWFKKQRYHCVYEYPKETPVAEGQGQTATTWEPTSYADWEEMMDEPRLDVYPMEYDESNRAGDEEFYVSSSNRPFQFQSGEGKYVSQFFPGASSTLLQQQQQQPQQHPAVPTVAASEESQESQDEVDRVEAPSSPQHSQPNGNSRVPDFTETQQQQQQTQLGELRHTRDRLKLNLLSTSGSSKTDEDVIENRPSAIESTENPQNKAPKTFDSTSAPSEAREKISESEKSIDSQIEGKEPKKIEKSPEKNPEKEKLLADDFVTTESESSREKISESEKSIEPQIEGKEPKKIEKSPEKNLEREKILADDFVTTESESSVNLAVKKAPEVAICDEQDEKQGSKDLKSNSADSGEGKERKNTETPSGDDLTVIQAGDEVLSANNYSVSIGDQKSSSEPPIISTSELTVEKIVDIPKLETEESPKGAKEFGDKNRAREVTTDEEISPVDEKTGINVQSSES